MQDESILFGNKEKYEKLYKDSLYFVNALINEYGFYENISSMIRAGSTELSIKKRLLKKTVDENWVTAIENALPSLDISIRAPSKFIEENEEVLPIELSRNITNRSLVHLAQHTDYIDKVEGDKITPSKILNVFYDETIMTYENKFLNTLILQLYQFIDRRYSQMFGSSSSENSTKLEFSSTFDAGKNKGSFSFGIEISEPSKIEANDGETQSDTVGSLDIRQRIDNLNAVANSYVNSEFAKAMGNAVVRPPIVRTNAIMKNKNLRDCLALWEFISSYDNVGYKIDIEETAEEPDETYINELYSILALQYVVFRYNTENELDFDSAIAKSATTTPLSPRFVSELSEYEAEDYDIRETEYRRYYAAPAAGRAKTKEDEAKIKDIIDAALTEQKRVTDAKAAIEKEEKRIADLREREQQQREEARRRAIERAERMQKSKLERKQRNKEEFERRKEKQKQKNKSRGKNK